jgi:hypothetical protein
MSSITEYNAQCLPTRQTAERWSVKYAQTGTHIGHMYKLIKTHSNIGVRSSIRNLLLKRQTIKTKSENESHNLLLHPQVLGAHKSKYPLKWIEMVHKYMKKSRRIRWLLNTNEFGQVYET